MVQVRMGRSIGACLQQFDLHLQRRVGQHPQKLELRLLLLGHQIQNTELKRADILMRRAVFVNHEQVFLFQYFLDRQVILYFDRQIASSGFFILR